MFTMYNNNNTCLINCYTYIIIMTSIIITTSNKCFNFYFVSSIHERILKNVSYTSKFPGVKSLGVDLTQEFTV